MLLSASQGWQSQSTRRRADGDELHDAGQTDARHLLQAAATGAACFCQCCQSARLWDAALPLPPPQPFSILRLLDWRLTPSEGQDDPGETMRLLSMMCH